MLTRRTLLSHLTYAVLAATPFSMTGCWRAEKLAMGIHPWIGYESLYLARDLGWLPAGVSLHPVENNSEKMALLASGIIEGGCFTLDEVLQARSQGIPLIIVLVFDISAGADVVLVSTRSDGAPIRIEKGIRIGYEANQVGELMLQLLLDHCHLSRNEVHLLDLPAGEAQKAAWQQAEVDVLITFEPYASELMRMGAKVAFSTRDFPQRVFDVLAVRHDRIQHYEGLLSALLAVHFKAQQRIFSSREDVLYRMAARYKMSYDEAKQAMAGVVWPDVERNRMLLTRDEHFQQAIRALNQIMEANGMIVRRDDLQRLFTHQYLPAVRLGADL